MTDPSDVILNHRQDVPKKFSNNPIVCLLLTLLVSGIAFLGGMLYRDGKVSNAPQANRHRLNNYLSAIDMPEAVSSDFGTALLASYDDHGGFHGDGDSYAVIRIAGLVHDNALRGQVLQRLAVSPFWVKQPCSDAERVARIRSNNTVSDALDAQQYNYGRQADITIPGDPVWDYSLFRDDTPGDEKFNIGQVTLNGTLAFLDVDTGTLIYYSWDY